ncbi:DUF551 domain-containing protein [Escherichia coli]|uniref:DUF551 domain-containing protein n=1 Tax=Salmonella sp. CQ23WZ0132SAL TaxID=3417699 RepID=UPI0017C7127C|nr:DUF551 domain-containing protein [Escherichia coli]
MTTITKERLLTIKQWRETYGPGSNVVLPAEEAEELARIALASLEAKPIGAFHIAEQQVDGTSDYLKDGEWPIDNGIIEVYAAPPVPVVPEEKPMPNPLSMYAVDAVAAIAEVRGWNACRAAMLQSGNFRENKNSSTNNFREIAETSTNYPVIPSEVLSAILKVAKIRADFDDFDGDRRGIGDCLDEAEQELIVTINKYASQLAVVPVGLDERAAFNAWNNDENLPIAGVGAKNAAWLAWQARAELGRSLAVNSPVTPDSWISCSERMPAQDDWILIYSKHGEYMAGQVQGEYVELSDGTLSWLGNALFWMPLPEPPQEVNQ